MHTALVRAVAVADLTEAEVIARLSSSAAEFLVAIHLIALPVVALAARPLGEWLRLPHVGRWHPGTAVLFVFVAVAARAVLLTGNYALFAAARFHRKAAAVRVMARLAVYAGVLRSRHPAGSASREVLPA
jgi:hypothetical protein